MSNTSPRVKILILGEGGVGKTSLLSQFIDKQFKPTHMPTIGVEYKQKIIDYLSEKPIRVQSIQQIDLVWDTAGTERFRTITPTYYKNCDGVLLVYDITDEKSFETIKFWINELNENTDISKVNLLLVGNKSDLEVRREVNPQSGQQLAKEIFVHTIQFQIEHFQTSAKDTTKTKEVFDHLILRIMESKGMEVSRSNISTNKSTFKLNTTNKASKRANKSGCCNN